MQCKLLSTVARGLARAPGTGVRCKYPAEMLDKIKHGSEKDARWKMLEISRQHAEWERLKREREKKKHDDKEAEKSE